MLYQLFPKDVIVEIAAPWMWDAELAPEEKILIDKAVEKRRREFTAGRTCARGILKQLGFSGDLAIGRDHRGAPLWPDGIVGSISHSDDACVVAIGRRTSALTSLGVDVEQDSGLAPELASLVCDAREREMCHESQPEDPLRLAKIVFSAKESVYKCLYPPTGIFLDFMDVHVRLDMAKLQFTATIDALDEGPSGILCDGRICFAASRIYTSCTLTGISQGVGS